MLSHSNEIINASVGIMRPGEWAMVQPILTTRRIVRQQMFNAISTDYQCNRRPQHSISWPVTRLSSNVTKDVPYYCGSGSFLGTWAFAVRINRRMFCIASFICSRRAATSAGFARMYQLLESLHQPLSRLILFSTSLKSGPSVHATATVRMPYFSVLNASFVRRVSSSRLIFRWSSFCSHDEHRFQIRGGRPRGFTEIINPRGNPRLSNRLHYQCMQCRPRG